MPRPHRARARGRYDGGHSLIAQVMECRGKDAIGHHQFDRIGGICDRPAKRRANPSAVLTFPLLN